MAFIKVYKIKNFGEENPNAQCSDRLTEKCFRALRGHWSYNRRKCFTILVGCKSTHQRKVWEYLWQARLPLGISKLNSSQLDKTGYYFLSASSEHSISQKPSGKYEVSSLIFQYQLNFSILIENMMALTCDTVWGMKAETSWRGKYSFLTV